jgi:hypothetical protein
MMRVGINSPQGEIMDKAIGAGYAKPTSQVQTEPKQTPGEQSALTSRAATVKEEARKKAHTRSHSLGWEVKPSENKSPEKNAGMDTASKTKIGATLGRKHKGLGRNDSVYSRKPPTKQRKQEIAEKRRVAAEELRKKEQEIIEQFRNYQPRSDAPEITLAFAPEHIKGETLEVQSPTVIVTSPSSRPELEEVMAAQEKELDDDIKRLLAEARAEHPVVVTSRSPQPTWESIMAEIDEFEVEVDQMLARYDAAEQTPPSHEKTQEPKKPGDPS